MPISLATHSAIEDTLNRIAAESILAQVGRDNGLVPAFSLLGDLIDYCAEDTAIQLRVATTRAALEALLDSRQPFDAETLQALRGLIQWLPPLLALSTSDLAAAGADSQVSAPEEGMTSSLPANVSHDEAESVDLMMALNLEENRELLVEFYAETVDHLQQIEAALLALDHEPEDPEALNSIFRSFHTIKGNAGFLGLMPMHVLAHEVESLFDLARNHKLQLNAAIITEILRSRDALQTLTNQVGAALEKGQLPDQIVPVGHLTAAVKALARGAPVPSAKEPGREAVRSAAPVVASLPPEGVLAPVIPLPVPHAVPESGVPTDPASAQKKAAPVGAPAKTGSATVRVNTEKLDSLMDVVGELVIVQSQLIESSRGSVNDNAPMQRNVAQLSRITKELQSTAMALRPTRDSITTVHGQGEVLDLRGRFIPIHRLNRRFGIPGDAVNPWDGIVVIVETSGKVSALLVDEMVSKQEVVIKNLGVFMQNLPGVSGGAILGVGNIALILDPGSLLGAAA